MKLEAPEGYGEAHLRPETELCPGNESELLATMTRRKMVSWRTYWFGSNKATLKQAIFPKVTLSEAESDAFEHDPETYQVQLKHLERPEEYLFRWEKLGELDEAGDLLKKVKTLSRTKVELEVLKREHVSKQEATMLISSAFKDYPPRALPIRRIVQDGKSARANRKLKTYTASALARLRIYLRVNNVVLDASELATSRETLETAYTLQYTKSESAIHPPRLNSVFLNSYADSDVSMTIEASLSGKLPDALQDFRTAPLLDRLSAPKQRRITDLMEFMVLNTAQAALESKNEDNSKRRIRQALARIKVLLHAVLFAHSFDLAVKSIPSHPVFSEEQPFLKPYVEAIEATGSKKSDRLGAFMDVFRQQLDEDEPYQQWLRRKHYLTKTDNGDCYNYLWPLPQAAYVVSWDAGPPAEGAHLPQRLHIPAITVDARDKEHAAVADCQGT